MAGARWLIKSKPRRVLRRGLGIALVLGLVCWGGYLISRSRAQASLEAEVALLTRLGVPTTAAEMRARVHPANNAAPLYLKAIEELRRTSLATQPTYSGGRLDPSSKAELRKWVGANSKTLEWIGQATQKPACAFERDWEQGLTLLFTDLASMKALVKLVVRRAELESEDGRFREALDWLDVGRKIAAHSREPTHIGQLISISGEVAVHVEFQHEIGLHGQSPEFLREARSFLSSSGPPPSLLEALKGEVFLLRASFRYLERGPGEGPDFLFSGSSSGMGFSTRLRLYSLQWRNVRLQVEAKALHSYRRMIEALAKNGETRETLIHEAQRIAADAASDTSWAGSVLAEISYVPIMADGGGAFLRVEAVRRLSRCGLELWAARQSTGAFPATLPTEVWATDPFTDKPFIYRPDKEEFVLYSVGRNGKDDAGVRSGSPGADDVRFDAKR